MLDPNSKIALAHLRKDKVFKKLMSNLDPLALPKSGNVFIELVKNIVYQQISFKAADTIYKRLEVLLRKKKYTPNDILAIEYETLKSVGLSYQKTKYIINICEYFNSHNLMSKDWTQLSDQDIIECLTEIKGVGVWTVKMILIFELKRPDIFPFEDLAIRQVIKENYGLSAEKKILIQKINNIAEAWKPYRTLATLFIWSYKRANS